MILIVPPRFESEVFYVFGDDDRQTRLKIDEPMMRDAGITVVREKLSSDELASYVAYVHHVDDGEAQALAMARCRGLPLLTDDFAGMMLAGRLGIDVVTTLDLLELWSNGKEDRVIRSACRRLRARGRYAPPAEHRLARWYAAKSREPGSPSCESAD
jgi:hypothetical protein